MKKSASNVISDPKQSLQTFTLRDLAQYTREGSFATEASSDFHLFYVGRDDVHDVLKYVLSRVSISLFLNMFGYDDDELNDILMTLAHDPTITTMYTLDRSQAGGVHEKTILNSDAAKYPDIYNASFVIGQSATHQISHTKGWVADAKVGGEGSTNWSASGEGTFVISGQPGGSGYKAQNNTQSVFTSRDDIARFQAELIAEHNTAKAQGGTLGGSAASTPAAAGPASAAAAPAPATSAPATSAPATTAPAPARKAPARRTPAAATR